jgi:RNA polymerase sigma-70 factor (ECF subfamily)
LTDAELVRGARTGDAEAWRALYERYLPAVWRQACALVSDVHAAEDVTSEAMLALLRSIGQLDADASSLAAWLFSVVRRQAADHHRKDFRKREVLQAAVMTPAQLGEVSPTIALEAEETRDHVLKVLNALPDRERLLLEWKYLEGLSVREIAGRLGETDRSIEAILYRARRGFRRLFELKHLRADRPARDRSPQIDVSQEP